MAISCFSEKSISSFLPLTGLTAQATAASTMSKMPQRAQWRLFMGILLSRTIHLSVIQ